MPSHTNPFDPKWNSTLPFYQIAEYNGLLVVTNRLGLSTTTGFKIENSQKIEISADEQIHVLSKGFYHGVGTPTTSGILSRLSSAGVGVWRTASNLLNCPWGFTVSDQGNYYFIDSIDNTSGGRVFLAGLSASGTNFFLRFGLDNSSVPPPNSVSGPGTCTFDRDGTLLIVDGKDHQIKRFTTNGSWLGTYGTNGYDAGQFGVPMDVAADPAGSGFWVLENRNRRIQHVSSNGLTIEKFGDERPSFAEVLVDPLFFCFYSNQYAFVGDSGIKGVRFCALDGSNIGVWSAVTDPGFVMPVDIAVGPTGKVYFLYERSIKVFTKR
ncbi:MAG: NHL repeat-containing protein [Spirochaetes bacterium]|nr:NHL repeat-containing protein [Spirochaetota bacterium]